MKSKIALAFDNCREKRPALITYTVAGDNTKNNSLKILNKISKYADILECGFPLHQLLMEVRYRKLTPSFEKWFKTERCF